jgi:heme-degrading monooxygenase HmoA
MILEIAEITIKDGTQADFEAALIKGLTTYSVQTEGYISHEIQHCMEQPTRYMLLLKWESLEAHTVNFRQGPHYDTYRALISPYFDGLPVVLHYDLVAAD